MPWPPTRPAGRTGSARRRDTAAASRRQNPPATQPPNQAPGPDVAHASARPVFHPRGQTQLRLFDLTPDLSAAQQKGTFPDPPDEEMAAFLDAAVIDHAHRHGWPKSTILRTRTAMRVLQTMQDTPGAILLASDAMLLQHIELPAINVIAVATAAGLMLDDRQPAVHAWFATTIADLPAPMRAELTEWFDVMLNGSQTPPRRRPRSEQTTRLHLRWAMPAFTTWAQDGHQSLREITPDTVRAVLPPSGNPRSTMGAGLRCILTLLKARKTLFINPIARITTGGHERRQPLPLDTASIIRALNSPDPACAAMAALAAFHGLRSGEVRQLHLTDLADGRLRVGDRSIPVAEPAQVRLSAWLDHRAARWPNTANPHLFINHRNAGRLTPVGLHWLGLILGMPVSVIRDDRILHEITATNGDIRRICDLFGLTVAAALRYLPTPDPDALDEPHPFRPPPRADTSSRTHTATGRP